MKLIYNMTDMLINIRMEKRKYGVHIHEHNTFENREDHLFVVLNSIYSSIVCCCVLLLIAFYSRLYKNYWVFSHRFLHEEISVRRLETTLMLFSIRVVCHNLWFGHLMKSFGFDFTVEFGIIFFCLLTLLLLFPFDHMNPLDFVYCLDVSLLIDLWGLNIGKLLSADFIWTLI